MPSLTVIKKRKNRSIDPQRLIKGELSKLFGLDPEDMDIGTERKAKEVAEELEEDWAELPVLNEVFFKDYIREPMFPVQQELCDAMLGPTPMEWPEEYDEAYALWGKGSGKDRTSAKIVCYAVYKLMCMRNPHRFLKQGEDDAIDIANMSRNSRQAKNVYFGKLKSVVRRCKDPYTGENWFEARGVDLREKRDIQSAEIRFTGPNNPSHHIRGEIKAHSLDSEVYTGEGYNLFLVILDELGDFPVDKGLELHNSLSETITSRFEGRGTLINISYMYNKDDAMQILMRQNATDPKVFVSGPFPTWVVNKLRNKTSFSKYYRKDPVRAKRVFECKVDKKRSGFLKLKSIIKNAFNETGLKNPIAGEHNVAGYFPEIEAPLHLKALEFMDWFKPKDDALYTIHIDLAKGKQKGDSVGFVMAHPEPMKVSMDGEVRRLMIQMGMIPPGVDEVGKGVVIDLALAIRGADPASEVRFAKIRDDLIYRLFVKMGFSIIEVTFDGYQSVESIQQLNERGIPTDQLSVDRDNDAYENLAELMYQGLLRGYPHIVVERELDEVDINSKGKIDHPRSSTVRLLTEGFDRGSKDVADCVAAVCKTCIEKIPIEPGIFIG